MDRTQAVGFASACKQFFGLKPGQTLLEFAAELKQLTKQDKEELAPLLSIALNAPVSNS